MLKKKYFRLNFYKKIFEYLLKIQTKKIKKIKRIFQKMKNLKKVSLFRKKQQFSKSKFFTKMQLFLTKFLHKIFYWSDLAPHETTSKKYAQKFSNNWEKLLNIEKTSSFLVIFFHRRLGCGISFLIFHFWTPNFDQKLRMYSL